MTHVRITETVLSYETLKNADRGWDELYIKCDSTKPEDVEKIKSFIYGKRPLKTTIDTTSTDFLSWVPHWGQVKVNLTLTDENQIDGLGDFKLETLTVPSFTKHRPINVNKLVCNQVEIDLEETLPNLQLLVTSGFVKPSESYPCEIHLICKEDEMDDLICNQVSTLKIDKLTRFHIPCYVSDLKVNQVSTDLSFTFPYLTKLTVGKMCLDKYQIPKSVKRLEGKGFSYSTSLIWLIELNLEKVYVQDDLFQILKRYESISLSLCISSEKNRIRNSTLLSYL